MDLIVATDDPRTQDVQDLLVVHMTFCHANSPRQYSHALDTEGLLDPTITLCSARQDGLLLGIGAIKHLNEWHGEVKSMHTSESTRGRGVGRAILAHLLALAVERGYLQVSLETGTTDAFELARTLYANMGFAPCAPFADYVASPYNTFMTICLGARVNPPPPTTSA